MKKNSKKQLALQRVINLIDHALFTQDLFLEDHISTAKKIIAKYKINIPFEYKILFCKNCKKFIIPGKNSRIRIGRSRIKALRITCKLCGHTYRKIIKTKVGIEN
ncbi:MAG: RNase P subunit [Nitrosopumilus sp.]|nr:RNase P subunit [Nitrosopumilus sp.]